MEISVGLAVGLILGYGWRPLYAFLKGPSIQTFRRLVPKRLVITSLVAVATAAVGCACLSWWQHLDAAGKPAWVQAMGALLGIGIAVVVPYLQRQSARTEAKEIERRIARGYVVHLLPTVQEYAMKIHRLNELFEQTAENKYWLGNFNGKLKQQLELPNTLQDVGPDTHNLGPMSLYVQRILIIQHWLERSITDFETAALGVISGTPEIEGEVSNYSFVGRYSGQVYALSLAATEAAHRMDEWLWKQTAAQTHPEFTNGDLVRRERDNVP